MDFGKMEHSLLVGVQTGTANMEIRVAFPQKARNRCITWAIYTDLGHIPKELCILLQINLLIHVHCSPIYNNREMETVDRCPSNNKWIKKMWYIYKMKYYSSTKKNEIKKLASMCIELEVLTQIEVTEIQKDKYHIVSLICECC